MTSETDNILLTDFLKYTSDIILAINIKLVEQEKMLKEQNNEINDLKKQICTIEKSFGIQESILNKNFEITSICEDEIEMLKKKKTDLLISRLIQKKENIEGILEPQKNQLGVHQFQGPKQSIENVEKTVSKTKLNNRRRMRKFI